MLPRCRCSALAARGELLSPEPSLRQRHGLSYNLVDSLSLTFLPSAAWQELQVCLLHAAWRVEEQRLLGKILSLSSLANAAGVSDSEMHQQLMQQMESAAPLDRSDCERTEGGERVGPWEALDRHVDRATPRWCGSVSGFHLFSPMYFLFRSE